MNNNETPSNGEIYRLVKAMSDDLKSHIDLQDERHEENRSRLEELNTNQKVANGRTGTNEKAIAILGTQFADIYKEVKSIQLDKKWLMGAAAVIFIFGSLFVKLYVESIVKTTLLNYDEIIINK